jgi:predicted XRE-type DNA-binding protein
MKMNFVTVKNPYASSSSSAADASDKHIRAQLMVIVRKMIHERGLNQTKAAALLGTSQARISEIINGKLDNHSIDRLFSMLHILGWDFNFAYDDGEVKANAEKVAEAA